VRRGGARPRGRAAASLPGPAHRVVGTWRGVIEGAETATAVGRAALPARLTIAEDGTWTLEDPQNGTARGVVARATADAIVLDGHLVRPASTSPGARVWYRLAPLGAAGLVGAASTFFQGQRVTTGIRLERAG